MWSLVVRPRSLPDVIELVLVLVLHCSTANALATWYLQADRYWPMRAVFDGDEVYDVQRGAKAEASVVWNPPQVGLRLDGQGDWVNLGSRPQSCSVDVGYCSEGLTVALWVNIRELERPQGWLSFGGKGCGVHLGCDGNAQLVVSIKSNKTQRAWELVSGTNHTLALDTWHHVAFTWSNQSDGISLYINGSRLKFSNVTSYNTSSSACAAGPGSCLAPADSTCDWSMQVGRQPTAHDYNYAAIDLADLALWLEVVDDDTILQASKHVSGIHQSNSGCWAGWLSNLQFCYYIVKANQTWDDAMQSCTTHKAQLVSIGSQEEEDFLQGALDTAAVSSCVHLGLRANPGSGVSWQDGSVWHFSRLNSSSDNITGHECVQRDADGSWAFINCSQRCSFVCKRYRDQIFRDAEFHCRAKRRDRRLAEHVVLLHHVANEIECAMECLIYGSKCRSYNFRHVSEPAAGQHRCEINRSSHEDLSPEFLVAAQGFQYCARVE